jgi:hypothetical protein
MSPGVPFFPSAFADLRHFAEYRKIRIVFRQHVTAWLLLVFALSNQFSFRLRHVGRCHRSMRALKSELQ